MHARGSRSIERYQDAIEPTLMDREAVKKLSKGQELSRSIHLAVESYQDCDKN